MAASFDLKQVGKLFEDALDAIRGNFPNQETLEPQAIEWLKAARYKTMREIQAEYYKLERSRNNPLSLPAWVDPAEPLLILTDQVPVALKPFKRLFMENLLKLLKDCGFQYSSVGGYSIDEILLEIHFPNRQRQSRDPFVLPETLDVEDEFARMADGAARGDGTPGAGGFPASDFGRLLTGVRGGRQLGARRASGEATDESNNEEPRLRSIRRGNSSTSAGDVRGSAGKRANTDAWLRYADVGVLVLTLLAVTWITSRIL
ncbi:hypothetical protein FB451DRAFT_1566571 [Mycena latifolia]|nr:hypothetical protein FB451DRAFT_1566571 [Mycena latifolia]